MHAAPQTVVGRPNALAREGNGRQQKMQSLAGTRGRARFHRASLHAGPQYFFGLPPPRQIFFGVSGIPQNSQCVLGAFI
jgi:hypothetical protein